MSYQVIARKYRPQHFADVVGQDHVTQTLSNAIASGRIAHAYLFCGPRGTGKTTLARIFAKCLNCTGGPKAEFPDDDPRAIEIAEGRSLDVIEIDGASNNGVDQVRELRETARFAPAGSKFKIYIIDEVHMLSTQAFNALLKTLEEPPAHVKFLFATTDPEKVLPTILSRCQRFDLRRIPTALIVKHLSWIASKEGVEIDDSALHAIARGADGGMRDAESTLDQLISFCGNRIVETDVLSMFGLAARSQLLELSEALIRGHAAVALRVLDELARNGKDLSRLLGDLLNHFRNLLLFQLTNGDKNLLEVSEAEMGVMATQNQWIDSEAMARMLETLTTAEGRMRDAASRRIFLEVTLIKCIQAREATSLDAVLKQLQALRQGATADVTRTAASTPRAVSTAGTIPVPAAKPNGASTPSTPPSPPAAPTPPVEPAAMSPAAPPEPPPPTKRAEVPEPEALLTPATLPLSPPVTATAAAAAPGAGESPIQLWPRVVANLGMLQRHYFEDAQPTSLTKGVLTISFPKGGESFDLANSREVIATLQAQFAALGAPDVALKFIESDPITPSIRPVTTASITPAPVPKAPETGPSASKNDSKNPNAAAASQATTITLSKEEFLNDPLIREAIEIFKATLVEVRAPSPETAA